MMTTLEPITELATPPIRLPLLHRMEERAGERRSVFYQEFPSPQSSPRSFLVGRGSSTRGSGRASRATNLLLIALVATAAAGCATAPSHFYSLNSTATANGAPPEQYAVLVGPVSVPASVDRPQFTLQVAPNRVAIDEFNRWAAPLNENIARVVAGDLAVLLGTPRVATAPLANFDSAFRVTIDIQRFESVPKESAMVEAVWVVRKSAGGAVRSGRTVAREPAQGEGFDALAAAHSRALAKISSDIAAAIRAEDDAKP